jgi:peptide/nickel transport system permease protein
MRSALGNRRVAVALAMIASAVAVAVLGPLVLPYGPNELSRDLGAGVSGAHPMGTDPLGRDVLSRVVEGLQISLRVGVVVAAAAVAVGLPLGLLAGYARGAADMVVGRTMDLLFVFPGLLLALVLATVLGTGLTTAMIALTIVYVPVSVRFIRSAVLAERARDYVSAAEVVGASPTRIVVRHIAPNIVSSVLVLLSTIIAFSMLAEASLSYLGVGAQPPTSSLGTMLTDYQAYLSVQPTLMVFPGAALSLLVLAFTLLGDGLRDHFDPRRRRRVREPGPEPAATEAAPVPVAGSVA